MRCVAGEAVTPGTRSSPITPRRERARGCCGRACTRGRHGRGRARGRCERERARGDCGRGAAAACAASGWGCQRGRGLGATARAADARRRARVPRGRQGGVRCSAGGRRRGVRREAGRSGRVRLVVCLGVRAVQCPPPYGVGARPARYHRHRWTFITPAGGWISPLSLADYHPLGAAGRRARRRRRCLFLVGCLSPLGCVRPRRDRPRGTHRLWNAAIKAAHGNGTRDGAEGGDRGYEWRRLTAEEALAYRAREFHRETLFRRAAEAAADCAARSERRRDATDGLDAVTLLAALGPLARVEAGLSVRGLSFQASRQRAHAVVGSFAAEWRGVSAERVRHALRSAGEHDLIPELGGDYARLGQAGDVALHHFAGDARLSREELGTVVYAVARAAAHHKARGDGGDAGAEAPSTPAVEPFAGRGKETRPVEDLRIVASNVCGFGLGVALRGTGAAALEADEDEPDMGDGCDLLTREGDTLQGAGGVGPARGRGLRAGRILGDESDRPQRHIWPCASAQCWLRLRPHGGCDERQRGGDRRRHGHMGDVSDAAGDGLQGSSTDP